MNTLTEILSHPFVHKLGWTLLHLVWQGTAVAVVLAIVLRVLRKSSSNVRYVVACLSLALIIAGLVVTFCLVSAPPDPSGIESAPLAPLADSFLSRRTADMPVARAAEYMEIFTRTSWTQKVEAFFAPALPYIVAGWLLGVFSLSLYHLGGWTHLQRLRRRLTKQVDETLLRTLRKLSERLKIARPIQLFESALVQIPTVVGWLRPVILLPACALSGLTGDQLEALLAHELAHIRRGDYLINMLQTVVEILGFYHPAVWWISSKIRVERENCCDDIAVAICGDKMHYATALAEMERIRSTQGELAMAANGGNLLTRIRRLIGKSPAPKSRFNWAAALVTALVIAALVIPTSLALSRSRSAEDAAEAAAERTVELDEALPPAPAGDETEDEAQILFELKLFEIRADSKLIKDAAKEDGTFVRTDKAFAEQLLELTKQDKDAKLLANPRILVIEGKEGTVNIPRKIPYIAGYAEQPDGEPKPITKFVQGGFEAKVKGDLVGDNGILVRLLCEQKVPTLTTPKTADGREIQIPVIDARISDTSVLAANNGVIVIGCFQHPDNPDYVLVVQMVPHIVGNGNGDSLTDTRSTPVVEKNDDDSGKIVLEGDILATIPQKGSDGQQDATLRASKLTLNLPGMGIIAEGPVSVTAPVEVSQAEETEEKAQILFEIKYFRLPGDSKLIKEVGKDGVFVRTDKAFAEQLIELSKDSKDAKVLAAPRVIVIEGEEAVFTVSSEIPYIAGYTEQPDGEPKPITRYAHGGFNARVKGDLVGDSAIYVRLHVAQTKPTLTSHKLAKGREIQIPIITTTECVTSVTVEDNGVVIIGGLGGLESPEKPDDTLVFQMVCRIVREGDTEPLPVADSSEEISFTVAPQVITSVGVDTEVAPDYADSGNRPAKAVKRLIAILKGQAHPSFELLDSKMAVAGQLDDLRKLVGEQSVEILLALSDGDHTLIATKSLKDDGGREGHLVFHLSREKDKWTIDDIDFEDPKGLEDEMLRFDEEMRKASEVPVLSEMPGGVRDEMTRFDPKMRDAVVDKPQTTRAMVVPGFYELQHAKAADIAVALEDLVRGTGHKIVVDEASNHLIVFEDKAQHPRLDELIAELDVASPEAAEETTTRVFELRYAEPLELSIVLKSLLKNEQQREVRIVPDSRSNQLIIQGSESDLEQMGKLIEVLDVARAGADTPAVETVTEVVELQYADSQQVGKILVELGRLGRDTRIVSDARLNQLIIEAPAADLKRIEHLIEQIDRPVDEKAAKKQNSAKDEQLATLIDRREELAMIMQMNREAISQEQRKLGITDFAKHQDLMLQRTSSLLTELGKTESLRMQLEAQLSLLDQGDDQSVSPQERLKMRQEYVNSDATVKALAERIAEVEMELLLANQTKGDDHPEVTSQVNLLKALNNRLAEAKGEVGRAFDKLMAVQDDKARMQSIEKAKAEIEQNMAYAQKLRARLDREKAETDAIAQSQLEIQGLRDQLESLKAMYDEVNRRITDLRMQPQELPALYDIGEPDTE